MQNSATSTRAFNSLFKDFNSSAKKVETLSSGEYFTDKLPVLDFLHKLREQGDFVSSLGLDSVANGGTVRQSENGRVSIWFEWSRGSETVQNSITVSKSLSERMLSLCGDTDYRSLPNGAQEALRLCLPLLAKAFVGKHKASKEPGKPAVLMLAV